MTTWITTAGWLRAMAVLVVAAWGAWQPATAPAGPLDNIQQASRLEWRNAGLILDTPGRTAACDVLRFTPDGHWLLAAGDDKVVRLWPFDGRTLHIEGTRTLRWSINRESRGNIYALALSPDETHRYVAIAGIGMLPAGTTAILDRATGKVVDAAYSPRSTTHADVWAVAFSPSGERVAYGTGDGSLWLWDRKQPRGHNVRLLGRGSGPEYNPVRCIVFTAEQALLSLTADGRVLEWNLAAPNSAPAVKFRFDRIAHVRRVAVSADGKKLAAFGDVLGQGDGAGAPGVEVRSLDGSGSQFIAASDHTYPNCLTFDARGERLAVGHYTITPADGFYNISRGDVTIYDLRQEPPQVVLTWPLAAYPEAVAFHPDGKYVATAGGNDHAVTLWDLTHISRPVGQVAGPGHALWSVGLSKDGRYLGYRDQRLATPPGPNERGGGSWHVFDLSDRKVVPNAGFAPVAPNLTAAGWRVEPDAHNGFTWYVTGPGGQRYALPLQPADDMPRCYTFIAPGKDGTPRLVVGHYWGMSLFALTDQGPRLLRKYTGHQGPVTAVAPSADGTLLLTASSDQTIAAWSLRDWPGQAELGATFSLDGNRLVVDDVAAGSPAWEAYLTPGDEIVLLAFDRKLMLNRSVAAGLPSKEQPQDIEACLERLRQPAPGKELVFVRKNRAGLSKCVTTVRQRPLWQFFPTRDGEWLLWRCRDYYYDTSPRGDSLIGWQLSGNIQDTPTFYKAEQFRQRYNRPDLMTPAILKRLAYYQVQPDSSVFTDLEPPQLALDGCPDNTTADFTIRLSAKPRGDRDNQRLDEVILWINDYQFRRWTSAELTDPSFQADVQVPTGELRQGQNTISLQCYNRARGRATVWNTVRYTGQADGKPQLLGLIVGIGNYAKAKTRLDPLGSALDAHELLDAWKHTRYYRDGGLNVLADAAATRSAVLAQLDALASRARPDDLVIVSLAGHGFSAESMAAELRRLGLSTADRLPAGTFAFCGPGFDYRHPSTTCVTSNDLYARLVKVRGHKLILLDACHAGSATTYTEAGRVSLLRELTRDGPDVGPAILTACRPDETALENATIGEVTPATGLFAISVIRALGDEFDEADHNHDGRLTISELADYARTRVGKMAKELSELQTAPAPGYAAVQNTATAKAAEPAELKTRAAELSQHPEASIPQRERLLVVAARSADTKTP